MGEGGVFTAANIMIAAGCFVMLIGFVGCCGAMKESKWLLVIVCIFFVLTGATGLCSRFPLIRGLESLRKRQFLLKVKKSLLIDYQYLVISML